MASVMVTKVEKSNEDELWLNPKVQCDQNGSLAATHLSLYILDMMKVQRSSPGRRVEPQAYGGRKIQLLEIRCRYDLHTIGNDSGNLYDCFYRVASIRKDKYKIIYRNIRAATIL